MSSFYVRFEVKEEEVKEIFAELKEATEKIFKCYSRLDQLGIMTIRKEPPAATDGSKD